MRVVIWGAGGVGGYLGARLAQGGAQVAFVARGAHLAAMRSHGLRIESPLGDARIAPVEASDDPADLAPADVIAVTVKGRDLAEAAGRLALLLKPGTAVISFLNGVESVGILGDAVGAARVMGGICYMPLVVSAPGVIGHTGRVNRYVFGEVGGQRSARALAFEAACRAGGLDAVLSEDIERDLWLKFIMLAPFSAMTCLTRAPLGVFLADAAARAQYEAGMVEVAAVGRALGARLPDDAVARNMAFALNRADPATRSSMLEDLERGRPLELDSLVGSVVRLAARAGVDVPFHRMAHAVLGVHRDGHQSR
ncbi:MAG: 2-dehydropantoate 2-reductase [Alphaproteobacteria bacterium]|nr:2-dehydropantoate 2-reductase [Alphaproteobacteria bacterium]